MLTTDPASYSISGYGILHRRRRGHHREHRWTSDDRARQLRLQALRRIADSVRSGPSSRRLSFIIIGGNLDLWTYWGGSIILGYSGDEDIAIKGIISSTVPHKVLSWRRSYN
jgi:hypothetical protein